MSGTIGERLAEAREACHLTLEQVARATRMRVHYLEALERGDFSVMPSAVQGRGFLRLYAQFLGLDIEKLLADLSQPEVGVETGLVGPLGESEETAFEEAETLEAGEAGPQEKPKREWFWRRWLRRPATAGAGSESEETSEAVEAPPVEVEAAQVEEERLAEAETAALESEVGEAAEESLGETLRAEPFWGRWPGWLRQQVSRLPIKRRQAAAESAPEEEADAGLQGMATSQLSSQDVFAEIGQQLRKRREMLSLTLEEIEKHTRVRRHYLQALEAGDFSQAPSPVHTRGMLSAYAGFLDMDADALLLCFAEGLQAQRLERHPSRGGGPRIMHLPLKSLAPLRNFIAGDLIFGIGMVVLLIGFAIWGASRIIALQAAPTPEAAAPSISDILLASPVGATEMIEATPTLAAGTSPPGGGAPTIIAPTEGGDVGVLVQIAVVERTWMRVMVDGEVEFEGRVLPGSAYPFEGENQVEILTGNAAALQVIYNQRDLGLMGNFGEVVDLVYTTNGILTPTAAPTATGTPTLRPSPTLLQTQTPTPTLTPVPSPQEQ